MYPCIYPIPQSSNEVNFEESIKFSWQISLHPFLFAAVYDLINIIDNYYNHLLIIIIHT